MKYEGFKISKESVDKVFPKKDIDITGWESPIDVVMGQMRMERETTLEGDIYRAVQEYGITVDRNELILALQYDRNQYNKGFANGYNKGASDVAREIFEEIEKQLARYSHLHRYAEEARQVTEEFADGTPCEMTSVWDVLPLHKNGWDDYETMNKLQENIEVIEKSRLLKEFEGDIAELKKKYESEGEG